MYSLNTEINKIIKYANTLRLKKEEFFKHNVMMFFQLLTLLIIHLFLSIFVIYVSPLATIPIVIINGYFIYFYLILTVHEGTHNLIFFSSNNKTDLKLKRLMPLLPLLAGYPMFTIYRKHHFLHHAFLSEKKDPQNSAFLNIRKILTLRFLKNRLKVSYKKFFDGFSPVIFTLILIAKLLHIYLLYYLGGILGVLLGFILPLFLVVIFNGIRLSLRHYNLYPNPKPLRARSYTFLGSSLIGPVGLKYHFEHHLYPGIPSYKLRRLYDFVEKKCPKELVNKVHYKKFHLKDFW